MTIQEDPGILFEKCDFKIGDEIREQRKELKRLELRKSNLQNDLMDRVITSHDYQNMKGRIDKELVLLKDKLTELQQQTSPFNNYIQNEAPMIENLLEYYRKSDGKTKKKLLSTIFVEKLVLEKGKVIEPVFTEPIQLILRISEVMRRSEKNKEVNLNQSLVATLTKNPILKILKLQPSPWKLLYISSFELVRVSECHKKKQEVDFDLLCLWVPQTDKSCNQSNEFLSLMNTLRKL